MGPRSVGALNLKRVSRGGGFQGLCVCGGGRGGGEGRSRYGRGRGGRRGMFLLQHQFCTYSMGTDCRGIAMKEISKG